MAKLKGKAKADFLKRMAKGRNKARRASGKTIKVTRSRRSVSTSGIVSKRKSIKVIPVMRGIPMTAVIANPGYTKAYAEGWDSTFGTKGKTRMAKRKKSRRVRRRRGPGRPRKTSSKRRRRIRRVSGRRLRFIGTVRPKKGGRGRKRRKSVSIYANPRRRSRRTVRRNPGFGSSIKAAFTPFAAGFITSMGLAVLDTGLAAYPTVRTIGKAVGAVVIAATLGKRYPSAAAGAIGALAASAGYVWGTKLAGGMLARTPAEVPKGLASMQEVYPTQMGALLNGMGVLTGTSGMGALLEGSDSSTDDMVNQYQNALADSEDDDEG